MARDSRISTSSWLTAAELGVDAVEADLSVEFTWDVRRSPGWMVWRRKKALATAHAPAFCSQLGGGSGDAGSPETTHAAMASSSSSSSDAGGGGGGADGADDDVIIAEQRWRTARRPRWRARCVGPAASASASASGSCESICFLLFFLSLFCFVY